MARRPVPVLDCARLVDHLRRRRSDLLHRVLGRHRRRMVRDRDVAMAAPHPLGRRAGGTRNGRRFPPLIDMSRSQATEIYGSPEIYIRGAQGGERRRARLVALITYGVVLTGLVVILVVQVMHERSLVSRLHTRGQQVTVTVTACR